MTKKRPNFLVVVADDLGFSDTSPYGGEIATPHLSRLAREGLLMTGFHTASACSPTRAMLLSGTDNHIAGLGQMAEYMIAGQGNAYKGRPGYEGYLNHRVAALPEILQDAGYQTIMSGKWHLGLQKHLAPHARGFDQSFVYLAGAGNHYNNEPQLDAADPATFWPPGLPRQPAVCSDNLWMRDAAVLDRQKELPPDFYSTKNFTDEMLAYLRERDDGANTKDGEKKPFFAYLAYTAPHWPLQAPPAVVQKYEGRYADGPEALRAARLAGLVERGLVPADVEPAPMVGGVVGGGGDSSSQNKNWADMTPDERAHSARRMETYAAMVDLVDQHLGRVLAHLEAAGELDDTLVLFMSDNGAEGKLLEALPVTRGVPLARVIDTYYDNSLANIGNADSFVWYGPRWACAATAPSRGYKTMVTEGGIRCPCVVRYPGFALPPGSVVHDFTTVMDILPTLLELAGVPHPGTTFRGREVVLPRGRSWVPYLEGKADSVHEDGEQHVHGWELFGRRAIRRGNWKAVFEPAPLGSEEWELYDLSKDLGEVHDLANKEPKILEELLVEWEKYFAETGMYDPGAEASRSKW